MNGRWFDDCFSDFRGLLIGPGKEAYENAIRDIETLVELNHDRDNDDWEGLSYVPTDVYKKKTGGNEIPAGIKENIDITGEEWDEDDAELKAKFPKLYAKWGIE